MEKKACIDCKWYDVLPFADEGICTNPNSEYADCPCESPDEENCEDWEGEDEEME